jgi:hypothetical protein
MRPLFGKFPDPFPSLAHRCTQASKESPAYKRIEFQALNTTESPLFDRATKHCSGYGSLNTYEEQSFVERDGLRDFNLKERFVQTGRRLFFKCVDNLLGVSP